MDEIHLSLVVSKTSFVAFKNIASIKMNRFFNKPKYLALSHLLFKQPKDRLYDLPLSDLKSKVDITEFKSKVYITLSVMFDGYRNCDFELGLNNEIRDCIKEELNVESLDMYFLGGSFYKNNRVGSFHYFNPSTVRFDYVPIDSGIKSIAVNAVTQGKVLVLYGREQSKEVHGKLTSLGYNSELNEYSYYDSENNKQTLFYLNLVGNENSDKIDIVDLLNSNPVYKQLFVFEDIINDNSNVFISSDI